MSATNKENNLPNSFSSSFSDSSRSSSEDHDDTLILEQCFNEVASSSTSTDHSKHKKNKNKNSNARTTIEMTHVSSGNRKPLKLFQNNTSSDSNPNIQQSDDNPPPTLQDRLNEIIKEHWKSKKDHRAYIESLAAKEDEDTKQKVSKVLYLIGMVLGVFNGKPSADLAVLAVKWAFQSVGLPTEGPLFEGITEWARYASFFPNAAIGMVATARALSDVVHLKSFMQEKGWLTILYFAMGLLAASSAAYNFVVDSDTGTPVWMNLIVTLCNMAMRMRAGKASFDDLLRSLDVDQSLQIYRQVCYKLEGLSLQEFLEVMNCKGLSYDELLEAIRDKRPAEQAAIFNHLASKLGVHKPSTEGFIARKLAKIIGGSAGLLGGMPYIFIILGKMGPVWAGVASIASLIFYMQNGGNLAELFTYLPKILTWFSNLSTSDKWVFGIFMVANLASNVISPIGFVYLSALTQIFNLPYLLTVVLYGAFAANFLGVLFLANIIAQFKDFIFEKFSSMNCGASGVDQPDNSQAANSSTNEHAKLFWGILSELSSKNVTRWGDAAVKANMLGAGEPASSSTTTSTSNDIEHDSSDGDGVTNDSSSEEETISLTIKDNNDNHNKHKESKHLSKFSMWQSSSKSDEKDPLLQKDQNTQNNYSSTSNSHNIIEITNKSNKKRVN